MRDFVLFLKGLKGYCFKNLISTFKKFAEFSLITFLLPLKIQKMQTNVKWLYFGFNNCGTFLSSFGSRGLQCRLRMVKRDNRKTSAFFKKRPAGIYSGFSACNVSRFFSFRPGFSAGFEFWSFEAGPCKVRLVL